MNSLNLRSDEVNSLVAKLPVKVFDDTVIMTKHFDSIIESLLVDLDAWHKENPHAKGLSANQVTKFIPQGCTINRQIIDELVAKEELFKDGNTLARPGYSARLSDPTQKIWSRVEPILIKDPTKPPVLHELAKQLSLEPKVLEKSLKECLKSDLLVRPVANRYFTHDGIAELKRLMKQAANGNEFTVKEYRDVSGIGRNLCIEILEYFDGQGITQRLGDKRKILKEDF
jgi:selenocysteine-specific elongation factor